MIEKHIAFPLPTPWKDKQFETNQIGEINFLVGPNGSGKSRFAETLKAHFLKSRLLGTDRLAGMIKNAGMGIWGSGLEKGLQKDYFGHFKGGAADLGFGIDTVVILEERMDLRVRVEATLSHLFNRQIFLEWNSGNLIAKATLTSTGETYRLDTEECHGIKELLVLLTHLYNDDYKCIIIDEPELNLHPQFQAFFMEEVRKVAGNPLVSHDKKIIFLITHSPFILDFRSINDLKSVISFDLTHSIPKQLSYLDENATARLSSLIPRLNVHHKQFFFSDNPIFVEGIFDAQMLLAIQEARGVSIAGAGSCVIDSGGCEEVNKYLELSKALGKKAYFIYDLDSLFMGNLQACVKSDETITSFLANLGLGNDFGGYCGSLSKKLTDAIKKIINVDEAGISGELIHLRSYLKELLPAQDNPPKSWARGRVAFLTHLKRNRALMLSALSEPEVADMEGRLGQIVSVLKSKNIFLLSDGALEHYLPNYIGDLLSLNDDAKKNAVLSELSELETQRSEQWLKDRYKGLYDAILNLPGKRSIEIDTILKNYLSDYIHQLQSAVQQYPHWELKEMQGKLNASFSGIERLFNLESFSRKEIKTQFHATIKMYGKYGEADRKVNVSHETNAGMRGFTLEPWSS